MKELFWTVFILNLCLARVTKRDDYPGDVTRLFGSNSPYADASPNGDTAFPPGFELQQVHLLARHGARYMREPDRQNAHKAMTKIQETGAHKDDLKFLKSPSSEDKLTKLGEHEMKDLGKKFHSRYKDILEKTTFDIVVHRTRRLVDSVHKFKEGFPEGKAKGQISVSDVSKPPREKGSPSRKEDWLRKFGPKVAKRLNTKFKGVNLNQNDVLAIMNACASDSVRNRQGKGSAACQIFTKDEWKDYDHCGSLARLYIDGGRSPNAVKSGAQHIENMMDEMKKSKKPTASATFSSGNFVASVLGALPLKGIKDDLPSARLTSQTDKARLEDPRTASSTIPFGARVYFETFHSPKTGKMVRVIANNRIMRMECESPEHPGMCSLQDFEKSFRHGQDKLRTIPEKRRKQGEEEEKGKRRRVNAAHSRQ